ncbi:MAG: MBL fold metallo-hydrolase [Clostridia bacterium]|nr:MBL fold metallo-hydrolase [Clostridia bacterium]
MKINIIRGQNQIGGSIIELTTENTRIILDAGANLGESKTHTYVPPVPGLFDAGDSYDGVFVSHYHSDHTGLLRFVRSGNRIFMGETAYKIMSAINKCKGRTTGFEPEYLYSFEEVEVGDFRIMPIPCDHSAYAAFMFLIHAEDKTILYTADYRSTGHLDFDTLLKILPRVDILITEGTTLSRGEDFHEPSEQELEDFAVEILNAKSGPSFVYLSAQNLDRIITVYHAACRTGRRFILDRLSAAAADAAGIHMDAQRLPEKLRKIPSEDLFAKPDFILCVTPQTLGTLEKLSRRMSLKDGVLFFGRREVYMLKPVTGALIQLLEAKGVTVPMLHTSGHADSNTIEKLVLNVNPDIIIPVHTENPQWFSRFEDSCQVIYDCHNFLL